MLVLQKNKFYYLIKLIQLLIYDGKNEILINPKNMMKYYILVRIKEDLLGDR